MTVSPSSRFRIESAVFFFAMVLFAGLGAYGQWFQLVDRAVFDALVRLVELPVDDAVVIVAIDEQSLARHGPWPWPREVQARMLADIAAAGPRAVLVDVVYAGTSDPAADRALVAAAQDVDLLALPLIIDSVANRRQLVEVLPFADLLSEADVIGHVHVELDEDAIVRGTYLYQGVADGAWPHVTLALAKRVRGISEDRYQCPKSSEFSIQNVRCGRVYPLFAGGPGSFPEVSALDVMTGAVSGEALRDSLVFVGVTASGATDDVTSPMSGSSRPMSGVEYNANLFNAIVQGRLVHDASTLARAGFTLACVTLPVVFLPRLRAKGMLGSALFCTAIPLGLSTAALLLFDLWLPLGAALVGCALAYPYWSWRRHEVAWQFVAAEMELVQQERDRWQVASESRDPGVVMAALGRFLNAEVSWNPDFVLADSRAALALTLADGARVVLTRGEPFSELERNLAQRTAFNLENGLNAEGSLPGEVLAAQIRRLQAQAEEARLGRSVGLMSLEEMPNAVAVFSALAENLFVNSAARKLLHIESREPPGYFDVVQRLVPALGWTWQDIARRVVLEGREVSFETQTKDGVPVVVDASPLAESGENVRYWVLTVTDMTDIRAAQRDREEALAFLSHDLRSPMLSVLALVRGAEATALLDDVGRYAQRALAVSDQFVQLSRVQARESFELYEVNLLAVLSNAVDQMYALARERNIRIDTDQQWEDDEEGIWLVANGELLERAFVNLLSNAIKYSDEGAVIEIEISDGAGEVAVDVVDHGIGIPETDIERIFEPYYRSSDQKLAGRRGAGLGLRFVKTVVERHGGRLKVASVVGAGSRFTVILPKPPPVNG